MSQHLQCRSVSISKWIALVVVQVNRQRYTLDSVLEFLTYVVPAIPVIVTHLCGCLIEAGELAWHMVFHCVPGILHNDEVVI